MSGHSKWSQIKRQKGITDQKRANVFTKLARFITVAVKESGGIGDPDMNYKLRLAVEKAKQSNMPKSNIDRAIDLGTGKGGEHSMEYGMYEGYGPGGIAVMVETVSDNPVRTYQDLKHTFDKRGGNLAQVGAVGYMFDHVGRLALEQKLTEEKQLELMDVEGVVDIENGEDQTLVFTDAKELKQVQDQLEGMNYKVSEAGLVMKPKQPVDIDEEMIEKLGEFVEHLEENDDVQQVYINVDSGYV